MPGVQDSCTVDYHKASEWHRHSHSRPEPSGRQLRWNQLRRSWRSLLFSAYIFSCCIKLFYIYGLYSYLQNLFTGGEAPSNQYHGIIIEKQCQARKTECK